MVQARILKCIYELKARLYKSLGAVVLGMVVVQSSSAQPPPYPADTSPSLGEVFGNLFFLIMNIRGLLRAILFVTSAGLFMSAAIRYQKYRANPVETPLSSVFMLLLVAVVLLILAFIPIQAEQAE